MTDVTIDNDALRLAASVYGPAGAPDILCLHGLSGSRDTWEETVRRLDNRYRVWTLDFRGHGHSDRAESYRIADYVADAAAALSAIGRPTIVIGHSLGGVTAASLAQGPHPRVLAVFLEDPPMYLGEPSEWEKGIYATVFPIVRDKEIELRSAGADLAAYVAFAAQTPAVQGGVAADHIAQRHLESIGSALQRHDPATWAPILDLTAFATFGASLPMRAPAMVIQADPALGPALMEGHEQRLLAATPSAEVIRYAGATHRVHATRATEPRFLDDVEAFVARHVGR
jgi:pimeloyl-ACP methyl ester carboxylesterase